MNQSLVSTFATCAGQRHVVIDGLPGEHAVFTVGGLHDLIAALMVVADSTAQSLKPGSVIYQAFDPMAADAQN